MKKTKTVVDAEIVVSAKAVEVAAAKETLKRLEHEHWEALEAVRKAQTDVDASLPQCRIVRASGFSGAEVGGARVVIVRRTPGGMLVVRHVGNTDGYEYKFKWVEHAGNYRRVTTERWASSFDELRDVPDAYLPTSQATKSV
jgi:hypothetical protein